MGLKIAIDVGGTFTDFIFVGSDGDSRIHKTLSTPEDPSIALIAGLREIAETLTPDGDFGSFIGSIDTIVHGTTVATNATLTSTGAVSGLLTTKGLRDALEMRRGVRERQYDNRYTNVKPLVPRYLRVGVGGRLDRNGEEITPLSLSDVEQAIALFRAEGVEAVSICFMNAYANQAHERAAAEIVRRELPDAYLTVSSDLLPSIRFYERISTAALNSYVGPKLNRYLDRLVKRLKENGFAGILLIMQSNGGVMAPQVARDKAALTLLSGPAGGPGAGLFYARALGADRCITTDMGGTSFEASVAFGAPAAVNGGEIARHKIALPMLDIHTIGAGGGSIGWLDEGGMLRVGPQSAGASPGPACYGKGGALPATTDANLVLGYLNPSYFAGGKMRLDMDAARRAIAANIAEPMNLSVEEAAAGMYRVACNNMAQGVREVTIKRGYDPREFPFIAAGGAGPIHSCLICSELEIPLQVVPASSSVLCAFGMLLSDLQHHFVRTLVSRLDAIDWKHIEELLDGMRRAGGAALDEEGIEAARRRYTIRFDCRYIKQYHEVSFPVAGQALAARDTAAIAAAFHREHNRLYGYSLEAENAPVELINIRLEAAGLTTAPAWAQERHEGKNASRAQKGERAVYIPETMKFAQVPVYDGHLLRAGNAIVGPAIIESVTTSTFVSASYDCLVDGYRSLVLYRKGREDLAKGSAVARVVEMAK